MPETVSPRYPDCTSILFTTMDWFTRSRNARDAAAAAAQLREAQPQLLAEVRLGRNTYYGHPRTYTDHFFCGNTRPVPLASGSFLYTWAPLGRRTGTPAAGLALFDPTPIIGAVVGIIQLVMYFVDRHERHEKERVDRLVAQLGASAGWTITRATQAQDRLVDMDVDTLHARRVCIKLHPTRPEGMQICCTPLPILDHHDVNRELSTFLSSL